LSYFGSRDDNDSQFDSAPPVGRRGGGFRKKWFGARTKSSENRGFIGGGR